MQQYFGSTICRWHNPSLKLTDISVEAFFAKIKYYISAPVEGICEFYRHGLTAVLIVSGNGVTDLPVQTQLCWVYRGAPVKSRRLKATEI